MNWFEPIIIAACIAPLGGLAGYFASGVTVDRYLRKRHGMTKAEQKALKRSIRQEEKDRKKKLKQQ